MAKLSGVFRLQYFFDVAEEIDLAQLRLLLEMSKAGPEAGVRRPAAGDVRFERPPVVERQGRLRIRYFDYGVVELEKEMPFEGFGWSDLISMAGKWIGNPDTEAEAEAEVRARLRRISVALGKPEQKLLGEDYVVVELRQALGDDGLILSAGQLVERYRGEIAQVVRGETGDLSATERDEVMAASISYSPEDLLVAGWTAALVYDAQAEGGETIVQLLEYANTQLLEFRHYDAVLSGVLADVYERLSRKRGVWGKWKMGREAERLNAYRLDVMELTERADNAIKFLSDMYYARAYKLAAARIGVRDYRVLVEEKLRTAGELYRFLMDEFHQGRAFVLELMIVIILIIDLVFLFRGKS